MTTSEHQHDGQRARSARVMHAAIVVVLLVAIGAITTSVPTDAEVWGDIFEAGRPRATVRNALVEARVVRVATARAIVEPPSAFGGAEPPIETPATWLVITLDVTRLRSPGTLDYLLVDGGGVEYNGSIVEFPTSGDPGPIALVQGREQVAFEVSPRRLIGSRLRVAALEPHSLVKLDIDLGIDSATARRLRHPRDTITLRPFDSQARSRMIGGAQ